MIGVYTTHITMLLQDPSSGLGGLTHVVVDEVGTRSTASQSLQPYVLEPATLDLRACNLTLT